MLCLAYYFGSPPNTFLIFQIHSLFLSVVLFFIDVYLYPQNLNFYLNFIVLCQLFLLACFPASPFFAWSLLLINLYLFLNFLIYHAPTSDLCSTVALPILNRDESFRSSPQILFGRFVLMMEQLKKVFRIAGSSQEDVQ